MTAMTPETYRDNRRRTTNTEGMNVDRQLTNIALGLGEAGEFQNLVKKVVFHGHDLDLEMIRRLIDEAGDLYFYLDWFADLMGLQIGEIFQHNTDKLAKRYPEGFSSERSINRDDGSV